MHTNDTTRVAAGGARFAPETRRVGSKFFRKIAKAQDLLTMEFVNGTSAVGARKS